MSVEYCKSTGRSSYVIGKHAEMLNTGAWQTEPQPHLPNSIKEYECLFKVGFLYKSFKFIGEYLLDRKNQTLVWFIFPYDKEFKKDLVVFSDVIKTSPYWFRNIYTANIQNKNVKTVLNNFTESNIFYATDLCGTDFKQVIDFEIKK